MSQQQYIEKRIVPDETIPDRLFACFADVDPNAAIELSKTFETGEKLPGPLAELHKRHLQHLLGLEKSDYIWEAGPSADFRKILNIYSIEDIWEDGVSSVIIYSTSFNQEQILSALRIN